VPGARPEAVTTAIGSASVLTFHRDNLPGRDHDGTRALHHGPAQATSPVRTEAVRGQIREGRHVFQAQMLARGAITLDGAASPRVLADSLLAYVGPD
jgi:hypothetical protein